MAAGREGRAVLTVLCWLLALVGLLIWLIGVERARRLALLAVVTLFFIIVEAYTGWVTLLTWRIFLYTFGAALACCCLWWDYTLVYKRRGGGSIWSYLTEQQVDRPGRDIRPR